MSKRVTGVQLGDRVVAERWRGVARFVGEVAMCSNVRSNYRTLECRSQGPCRCRTSRSSGGTAFIPASYLGMRSRGSACSLFLRRCCRGAGIGDDAFDQKNLLNVVAVQCLLFATDLDHNLIQCHGHDVSREDRAIAQLNRVVGQSAECNGNAATGSLVGSYF